jgi:hypothetical protein
LSRNFQHFVTSRNELRLHSIQTEKTYAGLRCDRLSQKVSW